MCQFVRGAVSGDGDACAPIMLDRCGQSIHPRARAGARVVDRDVELFAVGFHMSRGSRRENVGDATASLAREAGAGGWNA